MAIQVMAHRGASAAKKENTVDAFKQAVLVGSDAAELDVRRTADQILVVHHNATLNDGRIISQVNYSELPNDLCTLDEALDACAPMWVNVEIKNDPNEPDFDPTESIADQTILCLSRRVEGDERWLISSFRRETIDRCRHLRPSIETAWLTVGVAPDEADDVLSELSKSGHRALHPWVNLVNKELIDRCHSYGLQLNTWTCDDPVRMAQLIEWGIDGICTNVPDVAIRVRDQASAG